MFNYHVGTSLGDIDYNTCGSPCINKLRGNVGLLDDKLSNNINMVKVSGNKYLLLTKHCIFCGFIGYVLLSSSIMDEEQRHGFM